LSTNFLLLARYVPNVAKNSIWHSILMNNEDRPTDLPGCKWS